MIKSFTFNNKHSFRDFGIVSKSKNRPVSPEPKTVYEELPGMDGDYDFSEANPDGRVKYKARPIDLECSFLQRNMTYLRIRAHEIAAWLDCGEMPLIFDDETAAYYLARNSNKLDLETQIARFGRFTLSFKCRPFAFSVVNSNEQIKFGQGLICGYGYRLDMVPTIYPISGPTVLNVYNPGRYVKPIIHINGSCTTLTITSGSKSLSYNKPLVNSELIIDCSNPMASINGINVNNDLSGEYIEFGNGDNALQISGTGLNFTLTLDFRYLYL
ncbi:MAG: phage tail family protein [Bacillota bacterium]|nr:phage tail family protein [Bacillota bacterium]